MQCVALWTFAQLWATKHNDWNFHTHTRTHAHTCTHLRRAYTSKRAYQSQSCRSFMARLFIIAANWLARRWSTSPSKRTRWSPARLAGWPPNVACNMRSESVKWAYARQQCRFVASQLAPERLIWSRCCLTANLTYLAAIYTQCSIVAATLIACTGGLTHLDACHLSMQQ